MVNVYLEINTGTAGSASWFTVDTGDELIWTTSVLTSGTAYGDIPYITKPGTGTTTVERLWVWDTSGSTFTRASIYDGTVNTGTNCLRWRWDAALNSAPVYTAYETTSHDSATRGDNSVLGGGTETADFSHLKAVMCDEDGAVQPTASWTTAGTGALGSVATTDDGQSLNCDTAGDGHSQFLTDYRTPAAGNMHLNVVMYVSADEDTGDLVDQFSMKYTYT